MQNFSVTQFFRAFPDDRACLEHLRRVRWPDGITCAKCGRVTAHHLIAKRKCFSCQDCGTQVYPTVGTILQGSRTPLTVWLYVVFVLSHTRTGISAKQIERETGVTYKTAWRICQLVRAALAEGNPEPFTGTVEVDEAYVGGEPRYKGQSRPGRGTRKQPVFGIVERGDDGKPRRVRAFVLDDTQRATVLPIIERHVAAGADVNSDEYGVYRPLAERYRHKVVRHHRWEYAREDVDEGTGEVRSVHTNSIKGFWSQVKNGVRGVHRGVSPRYLQRYVDEYAARFSHAKGETPMFDVFLSRIAGAGQPAATLP